jgi:hypothetical protein
LPLAACITTLMVGCATTPPNYLRVDSPARIVAPRGVTSVRLTEPVVPDAGGTFFGPNKLFVELPAGIYVPFYETNGYVLYTCSTRCLAERITSDFSIGGLAQSRSDGSWHHWTRDNSHGSQPGPIALDDLIASFPELPGKVVIYLPPLQDFQPKFKAPVAVGPNDPPRLRERTPFETRPF